jgi:predicted component of type VI protein secretion system
MKTLYLSLNGVRHEFEEKGGILGRADDADIILADEKKVISKHHAILYYKDGDYYIRDTSTNGVFLLDQDSLLGKGNEVKITEGMVFTIGDYVISASFEKEPVRKSEEANPVTFQAQESLISEEELESLLLQPSSGGKEFTITMEENIFQKNSVFEKNIDELLHEDVIEESLDILPDSSPQVTPVSEDDLAQLSALLGEPLVGEPLETLPQIRADNNLPPQYAIEALKAYFSIENFEAVFKDAAPPYTRKNLQKFFKDFFNSD